MSVGSVQLEVILKAVDQLTGPLRMGGKAIDEMVKKSKGIGDLSAFGARMQSTGRGMMGVGLAMGGALALTAKAYTDLETAQINFTNAMADPTSRTHMAALLKQAEDLALTLPGTTTGYTDLATAMKASGASAEFMEKGAFKAAAQLKVLFDMDPKEAGQMFQEMSNAMGIAGGDAMAFADKMQRVRYAANFTPTGFHEALTQSASSMKSLKIQGIENSGVVLALMGSLKKGGLKDEQVGTAVKQFLVNQASISERIAAGKDAFGTDSKGAGIKLAIARAKANGVDMQFFKDGKYLGLPNAVGQLGQVGNIKNDMDRIFIMQKFFKDLGSSVGVSGTIKGVNEMLSMMRLQDSLDTKVARKVKSLASRWDIFTTTAMVSAKAIGETLLPILNPLLDNLNALAGGLVHFTHAHPAFVAAITGSAAAISTLLVAGGGLLFMIGQIAAGVPGMISAWGMIGPTVIAISPLLLSLAAVGWLIYKRWDKVGPAFKEAGDQVGAIGEQFSDLFASLSGKDAKAANDELNVLDAVLVTIGKSISTIAYGIASVVASLQALAQFNESLNDIPGSVKAGAESAVQTYKDSRRAGLGIGQSFENAQNMATITGGERFLGHMDKSLVSFEKLAARSPLSSSEELTVAEPKGSNIDKMNAKIAAHAAQKIDIHIHTNSADPKEHGRLAAQEIEKHKATEERKKFSYAGAN